MVPVPAAVDRLAGLGWDDTVATIVDEARTASERDPGPPEIERGRDEDDQGEQILAWWLQRMATPEGGLHERMVWFWHSLLTTNAGKVGSLPLVVDQLRLLRANALGDYRTLLQAFVTSGALLSYLDAAGSVAANPNENLARELLELFTLGGRGYTEDDVRAAARALAGWVVDDDEVFWDRERAFVAPLIFLGIQDRWDTAGVVDHLCSLPRTAEYVASRLWRHLVGIDPDPALAADLGRWWHERDLAILPLVERILTSPELRDGPRLTRPRSGLEWYLAANVAVGRRPGADVWVLEELGQLPYHPPNVAGWPEGEHWVAPGSVLQRLSRLADLELEGLPAAGADGVDEILDRCALHEVSATSLQVITSAAERMDDLRDDDGETGDETDPEIVRSLRWGLTLASPEFNLS